MNPFAILVAALQFCAAAYYAVRHQLYYEATLWALYAVANVVLILMACSRLKK